MTRMRSYERVASWLDIDDDDEALELLSGGRGVGRAGLR